MIMINPRTIELPSPLLGEGLGVRAVEDNNE